MAISKIFYSVAFSTILIVCAVGAAENDEPSHSCIIQPNEQVRLSRVPAMIAGLDPQVSIPVEGHLKLHFVSSDSSSMRLSPTGDFTHVAGPYDPVSRRLYIWGYFLNGWVEIQKDANTWRFGESGKVEPLLYHPADDIEDVTLVERSEALGVQFYIGFTAPNWLTGRQSYRVYQITGTEMSRVPILEDHKLWYVGDDPASGLAVFAPNGSRWASQPDLLVWYDGTQIVEQVPENSTHYRWCP